MMSKKEYQPLALEIIMDNYIKHSTKEGTREKRGDKSIRVHIKGLGQKMPLCETSWHGLLSNSENKMDLIRLFVEYLKSDEIRSKFTIPVTVTKADKTWKISEAGSYNIFLCNYEEADTRLVLHASLENTPCVVRSKDTDVLLFDLFVVWGGMPCLQQGIYLIVFAA